MALGELTSLNSAPTQVKLVHTYSDSCLDKFNQEHLHTNYLVCTNRNNLELR